ncbi:hypothetical protein Aduo_000664 [Ancylostoma duodenale]
MPKYMVLPVTVVSLSTAEYQGGGEPPADCPKPEKFPKEKSDAFIKKVNEHRLQMIEGNQNNGPAGNGNLPTGENVLEMEWSCELEKQAIEALNNTCPESSAAPPHGKSPECSTAAPSGKSPESSPAPPNGTSLESSPAAPDGTTGFY